MLSARRMCSKTIKLLQRNLSTNEPIVIVSEESGIRKLVMNRPNNRNALSMDMMAALSDGLEKASNTSLRCIVLAANGPVFSSGHNLKELAAESYAGHQETFSRCAQLCMLLSSASVPVLAAVDGIAAAAGCQLVAACDIVVATGRSKFSTPGANFGIFCSGPGVPISRSVGRKSAARMLFTGLPITAEEAFRIGLISEVCDDDKLDETISCYCTAIASKSRAVIDLGKQFFYKQIELDMPSAYRESAHIMAENLTLVDGKEGLRSFVEKRPPVWQHIREKKGEKIE